MTPYKIAVIELFSNEFRRDFAALYRELVRRLPAAISAKFDSTVFGGTAPGTGFDVLTAATAVGIGGTGTYAKLVNAFTTVGANGRLNGWAMSPQGEGILMLATDGNGYPLLMNNINNDSAVGRVLGARVVETDRVYKAGTPNVVGVAGDWTQARYGIVDGINLAISEEATINTGTEQVNLWQRNMFAVRVEAEVGFVVKSAGAFVRLTDATS
jgi:HK97 family phage major capsid protein